MLGVVVPVQSTGSMGVDLNENQLAVVEMVPFDTVEVGQIAVFRQPGLSSPTAHTVEHVLEDGRLKTRGRANTHFDPPVTEEMFLGVVAQTFVFGGNAGFPRQVAEGRLHVSDFPGAARWP